jgi:hypothetical protein
MEIKNDAIQISCYQNNRARGDVVNEKLRVHMEIFAKLCNKIHITTQNKNLSIGMNASL